MLDIKNQNLTKYFLLGISGSMILIATLFYAASDPGQGIAPTKVIDTISQSSLSLFLLFTATALIGVWFRALRYRILIQASGEAPENIPGMKSMVLITAVRGMVVDLLPARLGELIYVALLKKFCKTSIPAGLSSLLFAMLLDIAVLAPITILLGILIGFPNTAPLKVAILAMFVVVVFYFGIRFILPWFISTLNKFSFRDNSIFSRLVQVINQLNDAIQTTLHGGVFLKVIGLTIIVRGLKYIGLLILFQSVVGGNFPILETLSSIKVLAAMIASEMTAALPIPTLMSFGAWEVGGMTFMALFGAPPQDALLALLAIHIETQAVDYGIGLTALFLLFTRVSDSPGISSRKFRSALIPAVFTVVAVISAVASWAWFDDSAGKQIEIAQANTMPVNDRPQWLRDINGFIVWASNRNGFHDIMMMNLSDQTIRQLTFHPNTETHPRISPDGKKVAFIRSIAQWQSWRDQRPWNVWVLDLETGREKQVVSSGTAPTWSDDGSRLYFQRAIGQIWSYNFEDETETLLYERNTKGMPDEELLWPSIDKSGRLAVSYRDNGRPTNIISDGSGNIITVSRGCMLTWSPKNDFAMYVTSKEGGNQENQFNRYDPVTGKTTKWLDLPGELSHEYFPRLDQSQKYLVFAASDGAHEPDIEDYEIFIWKTDTPNAEAQRLTFHRGNDTWPDIFIAPDS